MCGRLPIGKGFSEVMHGWSVLPCVRPVKLPKEGERVSLGLRVTPDMKRKGQQQESQKFQPFSYH